MIYSEEGVCTLNDEITDKVFVARLPHILEGYQSYINPVKTIQKENSVHKFGFFKAVFREEVNFHKCFSG